MKLLDSNQFLEECRTAWKNSSAYRAMTGGAPVAGTAAAAVQKEDRWASLPRDALEIEFADRMEP